MGFKFNPFTGNFDQTGSGGGGASYIDGEVATYNDLPLDGTAALDSAWLVRSASGVWPVSRKQAGIYIRTATAGSSRDADYTYAGTMPDVFSDAVFTLYDDASTTRTGQFNLGNITAGQNRVLTWPDGNGTIARTSDIPSTFAASAITSGTLAHERGGLEADVSAYNGLVKISGGSTSAVTVTSAGEALLDDADAAAQRTTLGLGTAATANLNAISDADLRIVGSTDATKKVAIEVDTNVPSGQTVTLTAPSSGGTIALAGAAPAAHASSHGSAGSDPLFDQDLNTTDDVTFASVSLNSEGIKFEGNTKMNLEESTLYGSWSVENGFYVGSASGGGTLTIGKNSTTTAVLSAGNITNGAERNIDLPDASGTLALTSNIPANTIASTIVDAKGDLIVGTAADTVARLPVGATNGHVLTVDSAEASGMKWAAASGGVTSVSGTAPIVSSGGTTPTISVTTGSTAGTVAAGDDSRITGAAQKSANLSDLASASTARTNLGLGTAATAATGDFAAASHTHPASAISDSTTAGRALLTAADAAAQRTALSLAASATTDTTNASNISSGTLGIARIPTGSTSTTVALGNHSHELTELAATGATNGHVLTANGSGGVTFAAAAGGTPADNSITNAKLSQVSTATIKGRTTAGTGNVEDLTASQARGVLALATTDNVTFGSLQNTPIGSTTRSSGAFTSLSSSQGTITASSPVTIAATWNNGNASFTALDFSIANTDSLASSNFIAFRAGGAGTTTMAVITRAGAAYFGQGTVSIGDGANSIVLYNAGTLSFSSAGGVTANTSTGDTILRRDAANTLAMYNTSNAQAFRLYSTFSSTTSFERLNIAAQTGGNFILGTEKGSGGGTARGLELRTDNVARITIGSAGQLGFFGATAAAQPTAVADATDAATVITQLNALLSRMRTLGLIAT